MIVIVCQHPRTKKHGRDRKGQQRHRCLDCGKTFVPIPAGPKPLGDMRIDMDRATMALGMLLEDSSIRAIERLTGVAKRTTLNLIELVGERCQLFWMKRMRNLSVQDVQVDEIWGFVGCKDKTRERLHKSDDCGDAWTFMAIERTTKLVLAYHVGKRTPFDTEWFLEKLRDATTGRFQLSTDGFKPYCTGVPEVLRRRVDFAQLVKIYDGGSNKGQARYSPAEITGIRKRWMLGNPDMERVCTSHAERQNLNIRMHVRRMTRLTNAFSKKWTNHDLMLSIFFVWYNFCRNHMTLKTTPAVAAGLADEIWTIERMLNEIATTANAIGENGHGRR